jgi:hypothetical protein
MSCVNPQASEKAIKMIKTSIVKGLRPKISLSFAMITKKPETRE